MAGAVSIARTARRRAWRTVAADAWCAILAGLAAMLLASHGAAAQSRSGDVDVLVEGDRLSVDLDAVPLRDVLGAIAEQTGAELVIRGELGEVRPQSFQGEPFARAMRRLVGRNSMVMKFEPGAAPDAPPRLQLLMVYGADAITADESVMQAARRAARSSTKALPGSFDEIAGLELRDRLRAVRDLARGGDEAGLPVLAEIVARDEDPQIRRAAVANLARFGAPEASQVLQDALGDADPMVRIEAIRALGARDEEDPTTPLSRVLSTDPDATVRRVAVQLLSRLDSEEARATLEIALDDEDAAVRSAAANALER